MSQGGGAMALPPPMFPNLSRNYGFEPSAEELDKAAEAVKYDKLVKITGYKIHTFDLSQPEQAERYAALYMELYSKAKSGAIVIHVMDRKFVEAPSPRWLIHVEYSEYELKKTDVTAEKKNEKESAA
jgi:hypothetical protein